MKLLLVLSLGIVAALSVSCVRAQLTPEQKFWNWFQSNEGALYDFEADQERTFDRLSAEMYKLNPSLTFEFGPKENGRRDFVISADGIKDAFPEVEKLYATAPAMPRWKFIKFRPRRRPNDISYGGVSVRASSVLVQLTRNGETADVALFIPGYNKAASQTYTAIAFLFLDEALGEYDVETRVGQIDIQPVTKVPAQAYSLEALPNAFDALLISK